MQFLQFTKSYKNVIKMPDYIRTSVLNEAPWFQCPFHADFYKNLIYTWP